LIKSIAYIIYKLIYLLNFFFQKLFNKNILIWLKEFIEKDSYTNLYLFGKSFKFFTPNYITDYYIKTFKTKEPETIEWINQFKDKKIIFWDIGANIGLYSIYAANKFKKINIICFEPSTSNLRVLSRNISINKLENKIVICQIPLSNKTNKFLLMKENKFNEGEALNAFGVNFNFEGKIFQPKNNYKIFGTTINYLIKNKILKTPNYIKIDVDGIEHLILSKADLVLKNKKLKSICIELNENFLNQRNKVFKILKNYNFFFSHKKHSKIVSDIKKFSNTYNFVFNRR
jgi:FkbM family methyltransferase